MFPEEVICGAAVLLSHERERMQDWTANERPPTPVTRTLTGLELSLT